MTKTHEIFNRLYSEKIGKEVEFSDKYLRARFGKIDLFEINNMFDNWLKRHELDSEYRMNMEYSYYNDIKRKRCHIKYNHKEVAKASIPKKYNIDELIKEAYNNMVQTGRTSFVLCDGISIVFY